MVNSPIKGANQLSAQPNGYYQYVAAAMKYEATAREKQDLSEAKDILTNIENQYKNQDQPEVTAIIQVVDWNLMPWKKPVHWE